MKRVTITYSLRASSGVLSGSTSEVLSIGIDKATIRRRHAKAKFQREPLIPGSTMKGKLRNECERILQGLGIKLCRAPRAETMCPHYLPDKPEDVFIPPCAVCQLFGSPNQQSKLFFSDLIATLFDDQGKKSEGDFAPFATRVQAGVSLSRKRRTAEDDRLFYIERGIENLTYEGEIEGFLEDARWEKQLALLIAAIEQLVAIGGSKSRGAGWTKAEVIKMEFDGNQKDKSEITKIRKEGLTQWQD